MMFQVHVASMAQRQSDVDEQADAMRVPLLADICRDGSVEFTRPIHARIRASQAGESIQINGRVKTAVRMMCSRCLESFELAIDTDFNATAMSEDQAYDDSRLADEAELSANEMDVITYAGEVIDLGEEVAQQVIMALPYKPLCRDTCKGLCSHCGANLNRKACQCDARDQGNPFGILKTLTFPPK